MTEDNVYKKLSRVLIHWRYLINSTHYYTLCTVQALLGRTTFYSQWNCQWLLDPLVYSNYECILSLRIWNQKIRTLLGGNKATEYFEDNMIKEGGKKAAWKDTWFGPDRNTRGTEQIWFQIPTFLTLYHKPFHQIIRV